MNARWLSSLALAGLVASSGALAAPVEDATAERVTNSAEGRARDHAADELRDPASFVVTRRAVGEIAEKPRTSRTDNGVRSATTVYGDSWVYDATTDVFLDRDNDGYFHRLRVRFDADTLFTYSYVYAEIYISADGDAWEHLYTTNDFSIWGSDPADDYEVETDLVSGYSTALYDVLIELYDADTGELVDEYGPNESPEFSLLPLEDSSRDGIVVALPPESHSDGGGGAVSWLALPGLLLALLRRRRNA
jgi:hypothetical protein